MNNVRSIENLTEQELKHGIFGGITGGSWHEKYKSSAWVFLGGLSYELTEGDVLCVLSQWGEIEDIHLIREKGTNKSKGFAFVKFEDYRSTILAVDNLNGASLLGRVLRCDHVENYKLPKEILDKEAERLDANPMEDVEIGPGHAYKDKELASEFDINKGVDLWRRTLSDDSEEEEEEFAQEDGKLVKLGKHKNKNNKDERESKEKKHKHKKHKHDDGKKEKKEKHRDNDNNAVKDEEKVQREEEVEKTQEQAKREKDFRDSQIGMINANQFINQKVDISRDKRHDFRDDAAASWRGRRDPELVKQKLAMLENNNRRKPNVEDSGGGFYSSSNNKYYEEKKREELSGIGGFKRAR